MCQLRIRLRLLAQTAQDVGEQDDRVGGDARHHTVSLGRVLHLVGERRRLLHEAAQLLIRRPREALVDVGTNANVGLVHRGRGLAGRAVHGGVVDDGAKRFEDADTPVSDVFVVDRRRSGREPLPELLNASVDGRPAKLAVGRHGSDQPIGRSPVLSGFEGFEHRIEQVGQHIASGLPAPSALVRVPVCAERGEIAPLGIELDPQSPQDRSQRPEGIARFHVVDLLLAVSAAGLVLAAHELSERNRGCQRVVARERTLRELAHQVHPDRRRMGWPPGACRVENLSEELVESHSPDSLSDFQHQLSVTGTVSGPTNGDVGAARDAVTVNRSKINYPIPRSTGGHAVDRGSAVAGPCVAAHASIMSAGVVSSQPPAVNPDPKAAPFLWDLFERVGWTAGQQFFAVLLTSNAMAALELPWRLATVLAAGAAIGSLLTTLLQDGVQWLARLPATNFWYDLGVRLAKTFVSSMIGSLGAAKMFDVLHFDWGSALNLALVTTMTALAKGLFARQSVGGTASTLPDERYQQLQLLLGSRAR